MRFTADQIRDFWAKVDTTGSFDDCWFWNAGVSSAGYGMKRMSINGKHTSLLAHRMAWMLFNSSIPKGLVVCHKCDERLCVNPTHLFLGTMRDNTRDMIQKGRGLQPKLTPEQVAEVRLLRSQGWEMRDIAKKVGCSTTPVMRVIHRRGAYAEEIH